VTRDAARGTGISPDARDAQPLLVLAAALADVRELNEAEAILGAADAPELRVLPAGAAVALLRSRVHLAAGRLARASLTAGDEKLAAAAADAAATVAAAYPEFRAFPAAAAHALGLVHRDPACLASAATEHTDSWARASAAEDLGVLQRRRGDRDQAIDCLTSALAEYRQMGAGRDEARVRWRLRQLGIRRRHWSTSPSTRPVAGWHSLTGTEQAVACLVAQGLNNNQVAARMYISTHTVAHHLRQAFRKLSITSRVELARIVIEQAADGGAAEKLAILMMSAPD
jgi:DNA-binding CsgD family transcriptional regulator